VGVAKRKKGAKYSRQGNNRDGFMEILTQRVTEHGLKNREAQ
jgi:hypothetical protein